MFGERIVDRGRAQTAADAAALAATDWRHGPLRRGWRPPTALMLVSYAETGDAVTVVVDVDGERATARATDGP